MENEIWRELYRNIRRPGLQDTVAGFNINLDRIIPVTRELLDSPIFHTRKFADLRTHLLHSMQYCTAEEWFVSDMMHYRHFTDAFSSFGTVAIGGQAGIAALHLSGLGMDRVICAAPVHGPGSAGVLTKAGIIIPEFDSGNTRSVDYTHLVFEYPPGLVPLAPGVIPRNNRFIVSPVHEPGSVIIPEPSMEKFLATVSSCNRAFFSGYQYLHSKEEFAVAAGQITRMKNLNSSLRVHIECVSATDEEVTRGFVRQILPVADSLGLNERELSHLLFHLDLSIQHSREITVLSPVQCIEGALSLCTTLDLRRLHLHTFGYYILVIRKDSSDAETSRNALLFASREVAHAAHGTGTEISADGIRAVGVIGELFGQVSSPGIFSAGSYWVIVTPTLIARNITKTSGLGDILSSTAVVADVF
jgi:ADP-dependent phosphofructokinase/glucokinase